ncbi:MAG: AEC family transporter [Vallitaleaceae bacterium]|jgi:predicted permease|nr:AEC family transporter [Vallitaleaceae bacterium]
MANLLYILSHILLPIFLQIIIGYGVQKKLKLDISTLTKIQLYVLIPALIFVKLYSSALEGSLIWKIVLFTVVLFVILFILSIILAKLMGFTKKKEKAFINAITLRNQGNYGIPLITLVFAGEMGATALAIHMVVLFTTNLLLNTVGLYNASSGTYSFKETVIKIIRLPMIYAIIIGFIFRGFAIKLYEPIETTMDIMSMGVVPLALFTLGAQLSETRIKLSDISLSIATFGRLILSPLVAFGLVKLFGIEGIMAQVLILGAAAPTAVNSVLLSIEFDGDYEYASQIVMLTTILSIVTVSIIIQLIV